MAGAEAPNGPNRTERTEVLSTVPATACAALLGVHFVESDGDLPLGWHWLYLLDHPTQADLGEDGHPRRGTVPAPPGLGRRRMWASGEIIEVGRLQLGESATRASRVAAIETKQGRSGPLTFVAVVHEVSQAGIVRVRERQDIVYRDAVPLNAGSRDHAARGPADTSDPQSSSEGSEPSSECIAEWRVQTDPTLLFRFSALTYNAHRIHYDRDYACRVEGYPGLVVHGPLQALVMAELARSLGWGSGRMTSYQYRLVAPLFEGQGMVAGVVASDAGLTTYVRDDSGRITARGQLSGESL